MTSPPLSSDQQKLRDGLGAGLAAYLLWGFLPLLFKLVESVGSVGVVAERTFWSLLFVGGILLVTRRMGEVRAALSDFKTLRAMAFSALLLATNWLIYVWAVETDQVLEASFGYFVNPMVNVAIGMVVLGERHNRVQGIAILIALVALVIQAIGLGRIPYIALSLALSFGFYGFVRKTAPVAATAGLFVETLLLAPLAIGFLVWSFVSNGPGLHADPMTAFLLVLTGPATAVPLLLFNYAVQRLRLTTIGMLQYIAPSIAFVLAIIVFGEHLNLTRVLSFALIWVSLAVFTLGSMQRRVPPPV
ncbi:EamA family transporter RarD [Devosia sp.]|uniref:EamA family transporter RarD n=1 Tax=Devosia sp. TaxID=1871048 RepID=UPI0037C0A9FF